MLDGDISKAAEHLRHNVYAYQDSKHLVSNELPQLQQDYFKQCTKDLDKPRFLFTGISHLFYHGQINIKGLEVLTYEDL